MRISIGRRAALCAASFLAACLAWPGPAAAADPIKVGCSMALTGGVAAIGKQVLAALEIWKDDVNAKGGLLGRQIDLIYYDDQSNPANVAPIYTKLIDVDKVDLLIGPYATNMVAPAIPIVMQHNMMTIGILANAANSKFHYQRYFSMLTSGPEPQKSFSTGFFDLAMEHKADLKTVALVGADAEFAQNAIEGARDNLKGLPFTVVYDRSYPPQTTDYAPIMRAVQAANAGHRLCRRVPARQRRHRARRQRDRPHAQDVRRHLNRAHHHRGEDAARPADRTASSTTRRSCRRGRS